jgi:hypothetical protein
MPKLQRAAAEGRLMSLHLDYIPGNNLPEDNSLLDISCLCFPHLRTFVNNTYYSGPWQRLLPSGADLRCLWLWPSEEVAACNVMAAVAGQQKLRVLALAGSPLMDIAVMQAAARLPQLKALAVAYDERLGPLVLHPLAGSTSLRELLLLGLQGMDQGTIATLALAPALERITLSGLEAEPQMSQAECDEAVAVVMQQGRVEVQVVVERSDDTDEGDTVRAWLELAERRWLSE